MTYPIWLSKFTSRDGLRVVDFPLCEYEWQSQQALRVPSVSLVGADYAHVFAGTARGNKAIGRETVRFILGVGDPANTILADWRTMKGHLVQIGRGLLYTEDSTGELQYCRARLTAVPEITVRTRSGLFLPVSIDFQRESDWFGDAVSVINTVNMSPESWTVNNPGTASVLEGLTIRIRSNGASGAVNPTLTNLTNGYSLSFARTLNANGEIRIRGDNQTVEYSDDDGASYVDDWQNATMGDEQDILFALEPGDNTLRATASGTPNFDVEVSFDAPDH